MIWIILEILIAIASAVMGLLILLLKIPSIPPEFSFIPFIIAIIIGFLAVIRIVRAFKPTVYKVHPDSINEIKKVVGEELSVFTDGLPYSKDPNVKAAYEAGTRELARAADIQKSIDLGAAEISKQKREATLKAIEYYKEGFMHNPKTSERCALNNLIGLAYVGISDYDSAIEVWEESKKLAEEMISASDEVVSREGKLASAIALSNIGIIYRIRGDLDKAKKMHLKSLKIEKELGRKVGMASEYGNIGIIYGIHGDLDKAEKMHLKSLEIEKELGSKKGMASDYGNIGVIYRIRGDLKKAEEMYKKSLRIYEELGMKEGIASNYGNLGVIYRIRGDLEKAEEMHLKSLKIEKELGRKEGMASEYANLSIIYQTRGDLDKAKEISNNALKILYDIGSKEKLAAVYSNLGTLYIHKEDIAKAEEYYRRALDLFTQIGAKDKIEWCKDRLREIGKEP